ncbi:MAG: DUF1934 domain-containing protein [Lachnospiraceae bacterium]|nr:DUF1934 domain-containing protein [Lachnospiraceae bacterium]MBR7020424.1 DUF1934 domain-containing protein [Lachnospiraceae bacterium]
MDVLIKINATIRSDSEEVTESLVRGSYYRKDDDLYLFYEGVDEETPGLITRHRIVVSGNCVDIQRTGALQSKMRIVPGELNQCEYETPYGTLEMDFFGITVESEADDSGMKLRLVYEIRLADVPVSENELLIEATVAEEEK